MVLSASPADASDAASKVAPWIERVVKLLDLVDRGIIVLVDRARDAQLGSLVRALYAKHRDLFVLTEAPHIETAPPEAVIVLATRLEDAPWLNLARPLFAERAYRVVLWSHESVTAELARSAPDFFDWVQRRVECVSGPPPFAVAGLRCALTTRSWAVAWRGQALATAFNAAFPERRLISVNAALPAGKLHEAIVQLGNAWIAWSNVLDPSRVRQTAARARHRTRNVLDNPVADAPDAWPVSDVTLELGTAIRVLAPEGNAAASRLAALLDLEPEAISLAAQLLQSGLGLEELEQGIRRVDPGAAVARLLGEREGVDPVRLAACQAPPPLLRAYACDARVREARRVLRGTTVGELPPLSEQLARAGDGRAEFEQLMHELLEAEAQRSGVAYERGGLPDVGLDGWAPDGLRGLEGPVAFSAGEPSGGSIVSPGTLAQLTELKHLVVVVPEKARIWKAESGGAYATHVWGEEIVQSLLRQCPPLFARYYPQQARTVLPGYDGTDFRTLAACYRERTGTLNNRLKTIGIPPEARPRSSRIELPLDQLFIPLRLVPEEGDTARELGEVLQAHHHVVVLADPGMGKSTLLAYLALVFAGAAPLDGYAASSRAVPLLVSLREFVRQQQDQAGLSLVEYLESQARELFQLPAMHRAFFESLLRMGEAVLLLDGLDEVGNETARHRVAATIRAWHDDYPRCQVVVTSRIYGYTENVRLPSAFAHFRIAALDEAQIGSFVERWCAHQLAADPSEAASQAASLRAAVQRTPSVRRLATNPLLLTLMAFIHQGLRRLPNDRGELYDKCVEMLLKTWREAKRTEGEPTRGIEDLGLAVATQKDYLAHLAFFVQQKNQEGADDEIRGLVARRDAIEALSNRHLGRARRERPGLGAPEARAEMVRFLDYLCDETGLVVDRGNDQIAFVHLSFQEYLAAWVFLCGTSLPRGPDFFVAHLGDPAWEEVLLLRLYIVLQGGGGGAEEFDRIVAALLQSLEQQRSGGVRGGVDASSGWLTLLRAVRDDLEFAEADRRAILRRGVELWLATPKLAGSVYLALEEVALFAARSRDALRQEIAAARVDTANPADAIALLHLETKLFGFPEEAAATLRERDDLDALLAELVVFSDEPTIAGLLAERAALADWSRALRALDGGDLHRLTFEWVQSPPTPAAADTAMARLWGKIVRDLQSRFALAATTRETPDRVYFEQPSTATFRTPWCQVELPSNSLRALPIPLPEVEALPDAELLHPELARARLGVTVGPTSPELIQWAAQTIMAQLGALRASEGIDDEAVNLLAAQIARAFTMPVDIAYSSLLSASSREPQFLSGRDRSPWFDVFYKLHGRFEGLAGSLTGPVGQVLGTGFARTLARELPALSVGDASPTTGLFVAVKLSTWTWLEELERRLAVAPQNEASRESYWGQAARESSGALEMTVQSPMALPVLFASVWFNAATILWLGVLRDHTVRFEGHRPAGFAVNTWLSDLAVYAVGLAWQEHCRSVSALEDAAGALFIAHAAYASLMTGLDCPLPVTPNRADPRIELSLLLYDLCRFRDVEASVRKVEQMLASPAPELRPLLDAAGLVVVETAGDR